MICPSDNSCPINSLEGVTAAQYKHVNTIVLLQSDPSLPIPDFFFLKERCVECLTRTCSDKVYSVPFLPCSNFQSSAMFEGSERVEVEGGSTESTVASSISACKKVNKTTRGSLVFVLGWYFTCVLCVSLFVSHVFFCPLCICPSCPSLPLSVVCLSSYAMQRFSFPPLGCPWHPGVV